MLVAGLVLFPFPCVKPIVPGYLSHLTRIADESLNTGAGPRRRGWLAVGSALFVPGFAVPFVLPG